jgi:hypothetical protein
MSQCGFDFLKDTESWVILCGGGVEYLHHSPASCSRQQKWNPVPKGITRPPCYGGDINMRTWPSRLGESRIWDSKMWLWVPWDSNLRMTALARPAAIVKDILILMSERMLHKSYNSKCSVGNKITGRESQGACCQDKLIGGKLPVIK